MVTDTSSSKTVIPEKRLVNYAEYKSLTLDWPKLAHGDVDMAKYDNREEYVSVIITYCKAKKPEVDRASLLERCVESIHRHADYPFEVLVHDDTGIELTSLNVKDRISTLILNMGDNVRQSVAQNRMVKLATSRYIMLIEDDIELTKPCFKDMVNILKKPYVGFINPEQGSSGATEFLVSGDTRFVISGHLTGSWVNCFRKDTWKHVGGFPEWSHVSGPVFCFQCFKKGYWRGWFMDAVARDVDLEEHDNLWRTDHVFNRQNIPKVFHFPQWEYMSTARHDMSMNNYNEARGIEGSASNFKYWQWFRDALNKRGRCVSSIDWEIAKRHGQATWRDQIMKTELEVVELEKS